MLRAAVMLGRGATIPAATEATSGNGPGVQAAVQVAAGLGVAELHHRLDGFAARISSREVQCRSISYKVDQSIDLE